MIIRIYANEFRLEYTTKSYRCILNIDDKIELLEILDTAGNDSCLDSIRDYCTCCRESKLFVLVYSIASPISFKYIRLEYNKICSHQKEREREFNVVLVGKNVICLIHNVRFHMKWVKI